ncbi:MAG: anhydro-N-acetylmuramic acid kinase [Gammaproteobacteria bacterium]|nr:anhydro-N-acetylmuramic acid kinase [Gammaproteobacteria bacterium]
MTPTDPNRFLIGTMSGTSMDGLDIVAVDFASPQQPKLIHSGFTAYPDELKQALLTLASDPQARISQLGQLDCRLGQFYATALNQFIAEHELNKAQISAIGSHGQTILHQPDTDYPYTLQIGDPNIVAAETGVTVVADFRRRDIALGGQGAPLAPAFHNQVFRSDQVNRAIINIGGIANITGLPANPELTVTGFDSGPGNTLIDLACRLRLQCDYDEDGHKARRGQVQSDLVRSILSNEPFFHLPPPKSTGTDYFSRQWLEQNRLLGLDAADLLANLTELSAISIARGLSYLPYEVSECFVCGGGAHNSYLLERLQFHLPDQLITTTEQLGIAPDWVEAMAFAWLARQTLLRQASNLPAVTNAQNLTILGGVYY